jgi:hypothetical protein
MDTSDVQPERFIREVLEQVSRQRVPLVLQPGNVWVVDNAVAKDANTHAALMTCYMRGWIEPIERAIPTGHLTSDGNLPPGNLYQGLSDIYRVTSTGWSIVHNEHEWSIFAIVVSALSFLMAAASLLVAIVALRSAH